MELFINDRFVNRKVDYFNRFSMTLTHNAIASPFGFEFYFKPESQRHIESFCVSHYHPCYVEHLGERIITGNIIDHNFDDSPVEEIKSIAGYSRPGVLEDCNIPPTIYPLQSNGLSLKQIAQKLIRPFTDLEMVVDPAVESRMNKALDSSDASETDTVKSYLTELAKQKNIIISHDEYGRLLFTETKAEKKPILDFDLRGGSLPGTRFRFSFKGQGIHSHIYVQKQASIGGGNAGFTVVRNPYVIGTYFRPKVVTQTSGDDNDTELAAKRELANELKNLTFTIDIDRWDINGKVIRPNNMITLIAPELYIFPEHKAKLFIESISYTGDQEKLTATLNCVLPEVYTNETPEYLFQGLNLYSKPHI